MSFIERLDSGYFHYVIVLLVALFFLDEFLLAFLGAFLIAGLLGIVVLAAVLYLFFTRTDWGRRRWRDIKNWV